MKWLVVLDPITGLAPKTDTSLAIINQARSNGITVDTATIEQLFFEKEAAVIAEAESGREAVQSLRSYALILMRKEPPYDMAFHYATQLLSLSGALVVNSPSSLRNFNEKLIAFTFSSSMPATLVSSDMKLVAAFLNRHGGGVIKALDSFQGRSVQKVGADDHETVALFTDGGRRPVMVQQFLDKVYEGDKRVMMLGDRFLGAVLRRPKEGYHANFAKSEALKTELTPRENEIIGVVGPWMVRQGIHFAGLDFIGEQLTEINITCPTGIVQISEIEGRSLGQEIVDYFIQLAR